VPETAENVSITKNNNLIKELKDKMRDMNHQYYSLKKELNIAKEDQTYQ